MFVIGFAYRLLTLLALWRLDKPSAFAVSVALTVAGARLGLLIACFCPWSSRSCVCRAAAAVPLRRGLRASRLRVDRMICLAFVLYMFVVCSHGINVFPGSVGVFDLW